MATGVAFAPICQDNTISRSKPREKRVHHHMSSHIRPMRPNDNRQRPKLRAKQRPTNLISTDGTTSGDDGSETKNKQEEGVASKFEQMFKPSNASDLDLEADCEDNNYTDVDTVSLSGVSNKNESNSSEQPAETSVQTLHSKIIDLEKQLATVIQKNLKLTEENNKLRELMATHK